MGKFQIKFDNQLKQTPIIVPLNGDSELETGKSDPIIGNNNPMSVTAMYGIYTPLVKIGDIVVKYNDVLYMSLMGNDTPSLTIIIRDSTKLIRGLQQPTLDNELRLQIIPKFDNGYKKIDLTFYISNVLDDNGILTLNCIYKLPELYKTQIKCFGKRTTYDIMEQIALRCSLGFATNVESSNDSRYIYCSNESYAEMLSRIIKDSGEKGQECTSKILYDYWIDYWNTLNFGDIYERFKSVDEGDDMIIYTEMSDKDYSNTTDDKNSYIQTIATLSNNPSYAGNELYISSYDIHNNASMATDRIYSTYDDKYGEALDYYLWDGEQRKDIFIKHEYLGEFYGGYDYLLASKARQMMIDAMNQETIIVRTNSPLLALSRGSKVNVIWYDTNLNILEKKKNLGLGESDIDTNIKIDNSDELPIDQMAYIINKQVTGQYYILNSNIVFENNHWSNYFTLTRPRDDKHQYLDIGEDIKNIL